MQRSRLKTNLLGSVCTSMLALTAMPAVAQVVTVTDSNALVSANQNNNAFGSDIVLNLDGSITNTLLGMTQQTTTGSVVGTNNNTVTSSVLGNEAVLGITSTVNTETAGRLTGSDLVATQTNVDRLRATSTISADLAIAVTQNNNEVVATAGNTATVASVLTGDALTSEVGVAGNTQRSSGALNLAANTLTTTANSSNMSAGIASSQVNEDSSLTLTNNTLTGIRLDGSTVGATDSKLSVSGNTQSAFGSGNIATNTLTGTINNAVLPAVTGDSAITSAIGLTVPASSYSDVSGTFAIANTQTQDDVTLRAIVDGVGAGFELSVGEDVVRSALTNSTNTAFTSIRGNEASNTTNLALTNVVTGAIAAPVASTVAAIGNAQAISGDISATTLGVAGLAVETAIGSDLTDSQVATSSNTISAAATANTGVNRLIVTANDVETGKTVSPDAVVGTTLAATADAAFAVSSSQFAEGSVTAALVDSALAPTSGARIVTSVVDDISNSTITSNLNTLSAVATGNEISPSTNLISITGTNVATTSALANSQNLLGSVTARVGAPGVAATAPVPFNFTATLTGGGHDSGSSTLSTGTFTVSAAGFSPDQIAYLTKNGWALSSGSLTKSAVGYPATVSQYSSISSSGAVFNETIPAAPAIPLQGGVTIAAGEDITASRLSVDSNTTTGEVTGNTATNRVILSATNVAEGSALTTANANVGIPTAVATASADQSLTNRQNIGVTGTIAPTLTTNVAGAFAITQASDTDVASSTLSVSGNTQLATTTGNEAVNEVSLKATNLDTTAALLSLQTGNAAVSSVSQLEVYAPAATLDSKLDMNRNVNQSVATINTAMNNVLVSAANITSASGGVNVSLDATVTGATTGSQGATADNVLNNVQVASTSASATADTLFVNGDGGQTYPVVFPTSGIRTSNINVNTNQTVAQSNANTAVNTMSLTGGATLAATGGVLNQQLSTASSTATASSDAALVIGTASTAAVSSSTLNIGGNVTSARASGNEASNALSVRALSLTGGTDVAGTVDAGSSLLNGGVAAALNTEGSKSSYGVLNSQLNGGDVQAVVTSANYGGIFGATTAPASIVTASSIALNGNSVSATAMGNSASNTLTLAALNYGTSSAAIGNEQGNTADITAKVVDARVVLASNGAVDTSRLSTSGNSVTASAVGNSVTSTLMRN